jgi:murein DD-endopeptidase MepM/ murein hydrolase activator NlpD
MTTLITRGRNRGPRAAIVAAAGLSAVAVAHASLPTEIRPAARDAAPGQLAPRAARAAQPAAEPMLVYFLEPVPGHAVVSPFGLRKLPWEGGGRLHEGVDILADSGDAVRAAADGVVVRAGRDGGYGRFVAVRHAEGLTTLYAHLGAIGRDVKPGLVVQAGAPLGRVGSTGSSTGPHLHFEIRDAADHPLNPAMFLGKAFAEAGDLPLDKARRYSGRVRIAYVSRIPDSKLDLMSARGKVATVAAQKTTEAQALAAAERNLEGKVRSVARSEKIDGLQSLAIGADGRPRAQLSF